MGASLFARPSLAAQRARSRAVTIVLKRYSGFPPEFFERGIAPTVRDCTFRLYFLLCRESDRMSSRRISFTDNYAREQVGLSQTSMRVARGELKAQGVAVCSRLQGGFYTYEICDLDTGLPYPGDPKQKPSISRKRDGGALQTPSRHKVPSPLIPPTERPAMQNPLPAAELKHRWESDTSIQLWLQSA